MNAETGAGGAAIEDQYRTVYRDASRIVDVARSAAVRSVNAAMTAAYWMIGQRIVEFEQSGAERAAYGAALIERLAADLSRRFGRGFSRQNLQQMRQFYVSFRKDQICQTASGKSANPPRERIRQTVSGKLETASPEARIAALREVFPLPWSAYVKLLAVKNVRARTFYEAEALRGGWSVRQLDRQINTQFYERTALSKNKAAMLAKGQEQQGDATVLPEAAIKDPFVLEFLDLKDEYSESDLEEALLGRLETFLLELGSDFCFVGRQRRLRVGNEWYRVDLLFFHRRLRCLVIIDLKVGRFTHADAGQMLPQLRARALGSGGRESARRLDPLRAEGRRRRQVRARRPAEQGAGGRVSNDLARRRDPGGGNRPRARRPAAPAAGGRIPVIDARRRDSPDTGWQIRQNRGAALPS